MIKLTDLLDASTQHTPDTQQQRKLRFTTKLPSANFASDTRPAMKLTLPKSQKQIEIEKHDKEKEQHRTRRGEAPGLF